MDKGTSTPPLTLPTVSFPTLMSSGWSHPHPLSSNPPPTQSGASSTLLPRQGAWSLSLALHPVRDKENLCTAPSHPQVPVTASNRDVPIFCRGNMSHRHQHQLMLLQSHRPRLGSQWQLTMAPGGRAGHSQRQKLSYRLKMAPDYKCNPGSFSARVSGLGRADHKHLKTPKGVSRTDRLSYLRGRRLGDSEEMTDNGTQDSFYLHSLSRALQLIDSSI